MTTPEVLRQFMTTELLNGAQNGSLSDDDNLLMTGLVDSLGIMRLITFIEEKFGVHVPPEDVTIDNFLTINHITTYLEARIAA